MINNNLEMLDNCANNKNLSFTFAYTKEINLNQQIDVGKALLKFISSNAFFCA